MTETEYQMAVQRTHDAYCKTVIRHAAITAIRRLQRKWGREISLEYLVLVYKCGQEKSNNLYY